MNFNGKVIWITGASSGIGKALAMNLSKKGAKLILSSRRVEALEAAKAKCLNPENISIIPLDLTDINSFNAKTKEAISAFGKVDVLINNGGISQRSTAAETPLEIDRKIMEVNYFGNIALSKALLPHFQQNKNGYFVVISSLSGKFGFFLRSAYAASKHALVGFYESLRLEEEKNNIQVSLVFPGLIKTNISINALDKNGKSSNEMDNNQAKGTTADECAQQIIQGMLRQQHEIKAGGGELKALTIKRLFPKLFYKIIKKQSAK